MALIERLLADMNTALKSGDKIALGTIRLLRARIHELQIEKRRPLNEPEILELALQDVRRRREAIEQFHRGNRLDLVAKEEQEIRVLERYLPAQLGEAEIRSLIQEAIRETGASQPGDLGRVMGKLMPRIKGQADGSLVSRLAKDMLGGGTPG